MIALKRFFTAKGQPSGVHKISEEIPAYKETADLT